MLNTWQISINTFSGAHWIIKFSVQHKYNKKTSQFEDNQRGGDIPNKSIVLGDFGEIPLVTTGDTAFSHLEWLLKCFNQNARDLNERYYNKNCVVQGLSQKTLMVCSKEDGKSFTKSVSVNCTSSTLLWPLYYCIILVSIKMIHVNQDGDWVLMILSWLIQNQTVPNREIVKVKA